MPMVTFADLVNQWPSIRTFADDIGVEYPTAKAMRHSGRLIPARYWLRMVRAARARDIKLVTYELLAEMTADAFANDPNG